MSQEQKYQWDIATAINGECKMRPFWLRPAHSPKMNAASFSVLLDAFRAHAPLGNFVQIITKEAEDDPK